MRTTAAAAAAAETRFHRNHAEGNELEMKLNRPCAALLYDVRLNRTRNENEIKRADAEYAIINEYEFEFIAECAWATASILACTIPRGIAKTHTHKRSRVELECRAPHNYRSGLCVTLSLFFGGSAAFAYIQVSDGNSSHELHTIPTVGPIIVIMNVCIRLTPTRQSQRDADCDFKLKWTTFSDNVSFGWRRCDGIFISIFTFRKLRHACDPYILGTDIKSFAHSHSLSRSLGVVPSLSKMLN